MILHQVCIICLLNWCRVAIKAQETWHNAKEPVLSNRNLRFGIIFGCSDPFSVSIMVTVQLGRNKWKCSWRSCFDQSYYCLICLVLDWPRLRQGAAGAELRFALPLWGPTHVDRLHLLSSKQLWSNFFMSSVLWGGYIINHVRIKSRSSAPDDVQTPARCRLCFS